MLERAAAGPATYRRIRRALEAAAHGERTVLRCSTELPGPDALAYAEQYRLLVGLSEAAAVALDRGCLHVEPATRELHPSPPRLERRSRGERRQRQRRMRDANDPVERFFISLHGERRSGVERRTGEDRRALAADAVAKVRHA